MRPTPMSEFAKHCQEVARRFLLTAVVVDDELGVPQGPAVHGDLTKPDRDASKRVRSPEGRQPPSRSLDVVQITRSFAREGMVCGVISPDEGQDNYKVLAKAVARADIIILDWRLSQKSGKDALPLLERILTQLCHS